MDNKRIVGQRIVAARELRGLSAKDLATLLKIAPSRLSNWETGVSGVSAEFIYLISETLNVTSDFLIGLSETPESRYANGKNPDRGRLMTSFLKLNQDGQRRVANYAEDLHSSGKYDRPNTDAHIYTLGRTAAGSGYGNLDPVQTHRVIYTTEIPDHDFTLDVTGESMSPTISDGNIVFVRKNHDRMDGQVYVLDIDGETVIKRVYFNTDQITLVSDNPGWEDRTVTGYDLKQTRIEGIVVGWETPKR